MWKDYFSFNKRQRNGILVLLSLIVIMLAWLAISNHISPAMGNVDVTGLKAEVTKVHTDTISNHADKTPLISSIELNKAEEGDLDANPQLAAYSKAIIAYRSKLGGFTNKEQLWEIHDMDTAHYKAICKCISIDSTQVHKLALNKSTVKQLAKHPYIGHYLAEAIVNYRKQHGKYKRVADLLKNAAIDKSSYRKIQPYLSTE